MKNQMQVKRDCPPSAETELKNLNNVETTLLALVANSLFGVERNTEANADWNRVVSESLLQAVPVVAFEGIKDKIAVSPKTYDTFRNCAQNSLVKNMSVQEQHGVLHKLLTENGIKYCVLKGCASACFYAAPEYRVMGDVDFFVSPSDFNRTSDLLISNGFTKRNDNSEHHITFYKKNICLELHREPAGVPSGTSGEKIKDYLEDILEKTYEKEVHKIKFSMPSDFHHGLILLLHTYHHLLAEGIGLRHLCDWSVFVNSFPGDEFAGIFKEKFSSVGLWEFARILSCTASEYIGLPYKEWMGDIDYALCNQIICDIMSGGNFGVKDNLRKTVGYIVSTRGKNGVHTGMFKQFFLSVNFVIYTHWHSARKNKLLLVPGYVFFGTRHFIRFLFGKRKPLISPNVIKQANERRTLYRQFRLFETEE